jgi:hypothetical protein
MGKMNTSKCKNGVHDWIAVNIFMLSSGEIGCKLCRKIRCDKYSENDYNNIKTNQNHSKYQKSSKGRKTKKDYLYNENQYIVKARSFVRHAVGNGKLCRTNVCQLCHNKKRIEFHHFNYELDVSFNNIIEVCKLCHNKLDKLDKKSNIKNFKEKLLSVDY